MSSLDVIEVKESKAERQRELRKCVAASRPCLKMLLFLQKGLQANSALAAKTGVNRNCISWWKLLYERQGLGALLVENRGGHKQGAISKAVHEHIKKRLSNSKGGFTSYKQAQGWLNETFGLQMKYRAVNN